MSSPLNHTRDTSGNTPYSPQDHTSPPEYDEYLQFGTHFLDDPPNPRDQNSLYHPGSMLGIGFWANNTNVPFTLAESETHENVHGSPDPFTYATFHDTDSQGSPPVQLPLPPQEIDSTGEAPLETDPPTQPDADAGEAVQAEDDIDGNSDASGSSPGAKLPHPRLPRSRQAWKMSNTHQIVAEDYIFKPILLEMGAGTRSGQNLLAKYGDDEVPRLRHEIKIRRPKEDKNPAAASWPDPAKINVPAKTSLEEMCRSYPRHVWGTGLRIFGSEGWDAKRIYDNLPVGFRHNGAKTRQWNYLQAALGRELDKMAEEEGRPRAARRRGVKREAESDDEDDQEEKTIGRASKKPRQVKLESLTPSPPLQLPEMQSRTRPATSLQPPLGLRFPTMQPPSFGAIHMQHGPQPVPAFGSAYSPATNLVNAPFSRSSMMLMGEPMIGARQIAVQPSIQQLLYLCQQERQRHLDFVQGRLPVQMNPDINRRILR